MNLARPPAQEHLKGRKDHYCWGTEKAVVNAGLRSLTAFEAGLVNMIVGPGPKCLERPAASSLRMYLG